MQHALFLIREPGDLQNLRRVLADLQPKPRFESDSFAASRASCSAFLLHGSGSSPSSNSFVLQTRFSRDKFRINPHIKGCYL